MSNIKPVFIALRFLGLSALSTSLLLPSKTANAQNGTQIEINEAAVYDDNPLMRSDDNTVDTIKGIESTLRLTYQHKSPSRFFNTTAALKYNKFDKSGYNSTDFLFDLNYRKEMNRWLWRLSASFDYDTPRTANESTLGLVQLSDRRIAYSASPSVIFKISRRKSIGFNSTISQKNYSSGSTSVDHRTYSLSPFYSYSLDFRNTISAAYQYQRYQALSGAELNVDSTGPFFIWNHNLTPNMVLEGSLGFLGTRYTGVAQTGEWEINPIYSLEIEYTGQRNTTAFSVSRARQALTNGTETDITTTQLSNEFMIDPKWALNIKAEYKKTKQSSFSSDDLDNSYSAYIDTKYDISRDLNVSMSYRYAQESYITDRDEASRNVVRASVNYKLK